MKLENIDYRKLVEMLFNLLDCGLGSSKDGTIVESGSGQQTLSDSRRSFMH